MHVRGSFNLDGDQPTGAIYDKINFQTILSPLLQFHLY